MAKLYILGGSEKGKLYDLQGDIIGIGRSPDNDIQIKDASVSRNHLKIIRRGDKFFIEDLNSRNGTLVNDIQIRSGEEFEIKEGIPITPLSAHKKLIFCDFFTCNPLKLWDLLFPVFRLSHT